MRHHAGDRDRMPCGGRWRDTGAVSSSLFSCRAAAPLRRLIQGGDFAPRPPSDLTGRSNVKPATYRKEPPGSGGGNEGGWREGAGGRKAETLWTSPRTVGAPAGSRENARGPIHKDR